MCQLETMQVLIRIGMRWGINFLQSRRICFSEKCPTAMLVLYSIPILWLGSYVQPAMSILSHCDVLLFCCWLAYAVSLNTHTHARTHAHTHTYTLFVNYPCKACGMFEYGGPLRCPQSNSYEEEIVAFGSNLDRALPQCICIWHCVSPVCLQVESLLESLQFDASVEGRYSEDRCWQR